MAGALAFSRASNFVVQPQPAAGSCHARGHGLYSRPDPTCTPGALNPAVSQATIGRTICVSGWTATVRPPESITESEKAASLAAYGDGGGLGEYEYDHLVPLELGGATNDPRNLWPEPGSSPNLKDDVEFSLREQVCAGSLSLARAQREIASDWVALAPGSGSGTVGGAGGAGSSSGARCDVHAAYNPSYGDYDVYVHSNQRDRTVTVSAADGTTRSWHTDGSGYADVYFRAGYSARGERVNVVVGPARCSGSL